MEDGLRSVIDRELFGVGVWVSYGHQNIAVSEESEVEDGLRSVSDRELLGLECGSELWTPKYRGVRGGGEREGWRVGCGFSQCDIAL